MTVPQRISRLARRGTSAGLLVLATAGSTGLWAAPASATATTTAATTSRPRQAARPRPAATVSVPVVRVSDGDTIVVRLGSRAEKVRLIGIDTPELHPAPQCYAVAATTRMSALVRGHAVTLRADATQGDRDRYGRLLRHVSVGGRSLAQTLIEGGFGREFTYARPYAGRTAYVAAQTRARLAHRGLWGACPLPTRKPAPNPRTSPVSGSCRIKGNISSTGVRIYHLPGSRSYDATIITPSKGERWFCTEAQAVAAGWRKARG